jgi:hypothetical protein
MNEAKVKMASSLLITINRHDIISGERTETAIERIGAPSESWMWYLLAL